jgi:hypothetical protein
MRRLRMPDILVHEVSLGRAIGGSIRNSIRWVVCCVSGLCCGETRPGRAPGKERLVVGRVSAIPKEGIRRRVLVSTINDC